MQDKNDNTEALLQQLETLEKNDAVAENLHQKLSDHINDLININFEKLVQLLYRLDIDEIKLKKTLQEYPNQDAGKMIAALIIERYLQKIKSRQQFRQGNDNDTDENEKW